MEKKAGLQGFELTPDEMKNLERINLIGCGTAYFAAQIGKFTFVNFPK